MRWLADHQDAFTLFQFAATQESFAEVVRTENKLALEDTVSVVRRFIGSGRGADESALILANAIIGVSNQLSQSLLIERGISPEVVADAAVSFCLRGLLGTRRRTSACPLAAAESSESIERAGARPEYLLLRVRVEAVDRLAELLHHARDLGIGVRVVRGPDGRVRRRAGAP